MREVELDPFTTSTPETAMQAFVDTLGALREPEWLSTYYNGVVVFAHPIHLATPDIAERLTWSLRLMIHAPWLLRQRSAVTDIVGEIEAMQSNLRKRLAVPNIADPHIGLRLLVDLVPTLHCPWGGITIGEVLAAFSQCPTYSGWQTVPFSPRADERMLVQRGIRRLGEGCSPGEHWLQNARALLKF